MDEALRRWGNDLAAARLRGGTLRDPPGPIALADGYRLADAAAPGLGTPAGWKIGATSSGAMAFLKIDEPIRGRLFAERIWRDGAQVDLSGDRAAEAEPEIALWLARDCPAGGDPLAAVGAACFAAEIVRPSHSKPFELGAGFIVADNAAGLGALLGPPLDPAALAHPAALTLTLSTGDGEKTTGTADAVLGGPLGSLQWLAGGIGIVPAGSWILTGAMARAIPVAEGQTLLLDAGPHGRASLHSQAARPE